VGDSVEVTADGPDEIVFADPWNPTPPLLYKGGGHGGAGGGCFGPLGAGCLVQQAIKKALELLANEECAAFIAGDSLYDPADLLNQLTAGNPQYGNIQVASLGPVQGAPVNATTTSDGTITRTDLSLDGTPLTNPTVAITMNSNELNWQFSAGNDYGVSQDTRNGLTILHELGHAINFLSDGLGGSGIIQDGPQVPGGMALSQVNKNNTIKKCLH